MLKKSLFSFVSLFFLNGLFSQCVSSFEVNSTHGYTVRVDIQLKHVVPSSLNCPHGYNYNIAFDYDVTFTGTNIPSSLWTLQGHIPCGTETNNFFDLPNHGGKGTAVSIGNIWRNESDCGVSTPMSLQCNTVRLIIEGPGINSDALLNIEKICDFAAAPLPVELVSFEAINSGRKTQLSWTTASEFNNDFFEIQKSEDGKTWNAIGEIQGTGTTNQPTNYEYFDYSYSAVNIVYYRLRQVDLDGTEDFSPIRSVSQSQSGFSVFPNPSRGLTSVTSTDTLILDEISILNCVGSKLSTEEICTQTSENMILINTSKLPSGVYFIVVNGVTEKLIVE